MHKIGALKQWSRNKRLETQIGLEFMPRDPKQWKTKEENRIGTREIAGGEVYRGRIYILLSPWVKHKLHRYVFLTL